MNAIQELLDEVQEAAQEREGISPMLQEQIDDFVEMAEGLIDQVSDVESEADGILGELERLEYKAEPDENDNDPEEE